MVIINFILYIYKLKMGLLFDFYYLIYWKNSLKTFFLYKIFLLIAS